MMNSVRTLLAACWLQAEHNNALTVGLEEIKGTTFWVNYPSSMIQKSASPIPTLQKGE